MAALGDSYQAEQAAARALFDQLTQIAQPVYWAAAQINSTDEFEASDIAAEKNFAALTAANSFVYLQQQELGHPTSALIELGSLWLARSPLRSSLPRRKVFPMPFVVSRPSRNESVSGASASTAPHPLKKRFGYSRSTAPN